MLPPLTSRFHDGIAFSAVEGDAARCRWYLAEHASVRCLTHGGVPGFTVP